MPPVKERKTAATRAPCAISKRTISNHEFEESLCGMSVRNYYQGNNMAGGGHASDLIYSGAETVKWLYVTSLESFSRW